MLEAYIVSKVLDGALSLARGSLAEAKGNLASSKQDVHDALNFHLQSIENWCREISFSDLKQPKLTIGVYVDLDIYTYPRRMRIEASETIEMRPLLQAFDDSPNHIILLGQPGAGKTTSMKYICARLLHDEMFLSELFDFPIVLRFRELNLQLVSHRKPTRGRFRLPRSIVFTKLLDFLGIYFSFEKDSWDRNRESDRISLVQKVTMTFLDQLKPLIILEGFDELADEMDRETALGEIRTLAMHLNQARLIVTARTGEFLYNVGNASHIELCPLGQPQINRFAQQWLGDVSKANHFQDEVGKSPFSDAAMKPLTLAHLCAIYDRIGRIPDKPKTVYRKIVNLLLEEWDTQRSVSRRSRYAHFDVDRKFEFISVLAFELTMSKSGLVFSGDDLVHVYNKVCVDFDLPTDEARQVANEIETHNGLFVQAGHNLFEFAHKSLQEYLSAEYIVRLPSLPMGKDMLERLPNELAIAVTISSNPSRYLAELTLNSLRDAPLTSSFYETFVTRLLLEKPDFNAYDDVVIALFTLYSLYIDPSCSKGGPLQLSMILFDDLVEQFETFVHAVSRRNHTNVIKKYFKRKGLKEIGGGQHIVTLRKIREMDLYDLPTILFAREQFLELEGGMTEQNFEE